MKRAKPRVGSSRPSCKSGGTGLGGSVVAAVPARTLDAVFGAVKERDRCDRADLLLSLVLERQPKLGPVHEGTAVGHVDVLLHDFAHAELTNGLTGRLDGGRRSVFP